MTLNLDRNLELDLIFSPNIVSKISFHKEFLFKKYFQLFCV